MVKDYVYSHGDGIDIQQRRAASVGVMADE